MKSVRRVPLVLAALLAFTIPCVSFAQAAESAGLETEEEKLLYAIGMALSQKLPDFNFTEAEVAIVLQGIEDTALKRPPKVDLMQYGPKLNDFAKARFAASAAAEKAEGAKFLDKMAAEEGAERTESGLIFKELSAGTGETPGPTDTVTVHYTGTLRDGKVFDSSVERGQPATFAVNGVIKCWTEGLQKMKVGGKSQLVCPPEIAYGDQGTGGIPGGSVLVFEVELLGIEAPPATGDSE